VIDFKRVVIPKPPVGGKSAVFQEPGLFLLEEGPGLIWHLCCMHTGANGAELYDVQLSEDGKDLVTARQMFSLSPPVLGVWHLNVGFQFGLALRVHKSSNPHAGGGVAGLFVPVWMAKGSSDAAWKGRVRKEKTIEGSGQIREVLSTRDSVLYQAQVIMSGMGPARVKDGTGRLLWEAPKGVAGSFVLEHVFAKDGLKLEVDSNVSVRLTLTWYEGE
jgi:hypothetical protein